MAIASVNGGLRGALKRHPILWAWLVCFIFETGMNAVFGYRQAGAGFALVSFLYGAIFVALAFLGAWTCVELFKVRGSTGTAWGRRAAVGIPFAGCLIVSQFSGWGVLGVTLADGGARRDVAATKSQTAAEYLGQKKQQRADLVLPKEAKASLAAKLSLELRRTSKQYPNGDGPAAMDLKSKIAAWDAAEALDKEIRDAMSALETAPAVAGGNPEFAVVTDWTAAPPETVRKWWSVFLVALIGGFANFLPAIVLAAEVQPAGKASSDFLDRMDWGAPRLAAGGERQLYDELVRLYGPEAAEHLTVDPQVSALKAKLAEAMKDPVATVRGRGEWRTPPAPGEMPAEPRPPLNGAPPAFPPRFDAPQHVHQGAPINITFGGLPGPHAVGPPAPATPPQREAQPFSAAPAAGPRHQAEPHAPLLTGPPVDRSQARNRHDQILLFKQYSLEATPGALVSADDMYARYAAWAGRRCMGPVLFHELFSEVAEVPITQIGGQLYYADFAVRTSAVRAVS